MPCYMTGSYAGDQELSLHELREKATRVNAILCEVMEWAEDSDDGMILRVMPESAQEWWEAHKKTDADRVEAEKHYRQQRIEQLKAELAEAEALGQ